MQILTVGEILMFYADDINKHWNGKVRGGADLVLFDTYVYIVDIVDNKRNPPIYWKYYYCKVKNTFSIYI